MLNRIKRIAPNVAITITREYDPYYQWVGDAPDESHSGHLPYTVAVKATAIIRGELVEALDALCGCHYHPDEELGDVHGYLPDMITQAVNVLLKRAKHRFPDSQSLANAAALNELEAACGAIKAELAKLQKERITANDDKI